MELDKEQMLLKQARDRGNQPASSMTIREHIAFEVMKLCLEKGFRAVDFKDLGMVCFTVADVMLQESVKDQSK